MLTIGVDTYVSVEEADLYVTRNYLSTEAFFITWHDLEPMQKEVFLRRSAREMNSLAYTGRKCTPEQALAFPRFLQTSRPMHQTVEVPEDIKIAQIENALSIADPSVAEDAAFYQKMRTFGIASYSVGHMSETLVQWNGGGNSSLDKSRTGSLTSTVASLLIQPYLVSGVDIR